jgi:hypothetical protein
VLKKQAKLDDDAETKPLEKKEGKYFNDNTNAIKSIDPKKPVVSEVAEEKELN